MEKVETLFGTITKRSYTNMSKQNQIKPPVTLVAEVKVTGKPSTQEFGRMLKQSKKIIVAKGPVSFLDPSKVPLD